MNDSTSTPYGKKFYEYNTGGSYSSANLYLDHFCNFFGTPNSVLDVGCGRGTWLKKFDELGSKNLVGIDGDWVEGKMVSDSINFFPADLNYLNNRLFLNKKFDVTISLEVAEHLIPESSEQFIKFITSYSDLVIFSAATPFQGGTSHTNENFQNYWSNMFKQHDFYPIDFFRPEFWMRSEVEACYRQNTFIYIKRKGIFEKKIEGIYSEINSNFMNCLHPEIYLNRSGRDAIKDFFRNMRNVLRTKLNA